jgi:hypothetical protein
MKILLEASLIMVLEDYCGHTQIEIADLINDFISYLQYFFM